MVQKWLIYGPKMAQKWHQHKKMAHIWSKNGSKMATVKKKWLIYGPKMAQKWHR